MPAWNLLVAVCLAYVAGLFALAFWAERRAARGRLGWLRSPFVYTLSLSIYCTAWTFYGAVGTAARGGLEYLPIYLGPTLVFLGWAFWLRKLVRVGRTQRITSIADLISSRYGKSPALGVVVTLLAVLGSTPYIALQLKSVTLSFTAFAAHEGGGAPAGGSAALAFWVALGLAAFTILFGARNLDANERHHGVVAAIAAEALVKLAALVAVGVFVVWGLFPGPAAVFAAAPPELRAAQDLLTPRWVALLVLSAAAVVCLPRMFQVMVVEAEHERHLATAGWAFPLYLALMSLFVLPIAAAGLATTPWADPDLYVLGVPLAAGRTDVALLAFLGGFSAATSMVVVASIALSTMISNHILLPLWLRGARARSGDLRRMVLLSRRVAIAGVLGLGYVYFLLSGPEALAAIGLISFAAMAQVAPALIAALYWRGATRAGALAGLAAGALVWAYTLFLPSFDGAFLMPASVIAEGPFGIGWLRPQALLGLDGRDPLVHATFWSLLVNAGLLVGVSLATTPRPLETVQAAAFVDAFDAGGRPGLTERRAALADLTALATRLLGPAEARALFAAAARRQGRPAGPPDPDDALIDALERALAGSVGAASAHELVAQVAGRGAVSLDGLMRIADETLQLVEAKRRLERQSRDLAEAADQLRRANDQLQRMDALKDAFLSQVSHELRTPMTSIRSFAEILHDRPDMDRETAARFLAIIRDESQRLTRLLDEILDLSFLETGRVSFRIEPVRIGEAIERALAATEGLRAANGAPAIHRAGDAGLTVETDFDRLAQVLINLVSNAAKYGRAERPEIRLTVAATPDGGATIDVADTGPGVAPDQREEVFRKFSRLAESNLAGSAGLGLPIAREIMRNLGGDLLLLDAGPGATFRVVLPARPARASAAE